MSDDSLHSPEYALDRKIEALLQEIAQLKPGELEKKLSMISKLQELFGDRTRLMRPPPPAPPRSTRELAF